MDEPSLLSIEQVALRLSVSRTTVYRLGRAGALDMVRIGRRVLVSAPSLERYMRGLPLVQVPNAGLLAAIRRRAITWSQR